MTRTSADRLDRSAATQAVCGIGTRHAWRRAERTREDSACGRSPFGNRSKTFVKTFHQAAREHWAIRSWNGWGSRLLPPLLAGCLGLGIHARARTPERVEMEGPRFIALKMMPCERTGVKGNPCDLYQCSAFRLIRSIDARHCCRASSSRMNGS